MNLINVPLAQIQPYWRNPRRHTAAVEAVAESIRQFGFNVPLVVDPQYVLITGHVRYKALRQLGYEAAPCIVADLSPERAKAYRLADNKTAELAQWDQDKLADELRALPELDLVTPFFPDLEALLAASVGQEVQLPTDAQLARATTQQAEVFQQRDAAHRAQQVEVTCPHCLESFFLERRVADGEPSGWS